jgi:heme oxygenase (biliverdin-IX-beta and delta-forming)
VILELLKSTTAPAHASLERRLRIAGPRPSLADYRRYLSGMYDFTAPLEARWRDMAAELPPDVELDKRCKAHLLRADLAELQCRLGEPLQTSCRVDLPRTDDAARALGTLYVLEGSTLGARWLLRHLAPLGIAPASAYLQSYGDGLAPMWEKMRATLVSYHRRHPDRGADTCDAAEETFRLLDACLVGVGAAEASSAP